MNVFVSASRIDRASFESFPAVKKPCAVLFLFLIDLFSPTISCEIACHFLSFFHLLPAAQEQGGDSRHGPPTYLPPIKSGKPCITQSNNL